MLLSDECQQEYHVTISRKCNIFDTYWEPRKKIRRKNYYPNVRKKREEKKSGVFFLFVTIPHRWASTCQRRIWGRRPTGGNNRGGPPTVNRPCNLRLNTLNLYLKETGGISQDKVRCFFKEGLFETNKG